VEPCTVLQTLGLLLRFSTASAENMHSCLLTILRQTASPTFYHVDSQSVARGSAARSSDRYIKWSLYKIFLIAMRLTRFLSPPPLWWLGHIQTRKSLCMILFVSVIGDIRQCRQFSSFCQDVRGNLLSCDKMSAMSLAFVVTAMSGRTTSTASPNQAQILIWTAPTRSRTGRCCGCSPLICAAVP
jgi:hypothetical protein